MNDSPDRTPTTADDAMTRVLSARTQIAADRRCDLRVQCRNLAPNVEMIFCDCLAAAARRVAAELEHEHAE